MEVENNPYKQFQVGNRLDFTIHTLNPDGAITDHDKSVVIEAVKGGGFFGLVPIPKDEDYVIKTSLPDPWHEFWRGINWGFRQFPSQVSETAAQLDHLSMNLIHDAIPVLTNGFVYTPRSLGYTGLSSGFAQVIEKLDGRGPRYDNDQDEYNGFRNIQTELTYVCLRLGLEQAGQLHPKNIFAMANLWKNPEQQRWEWVDTLPAIKHTGFVWPLFYFPFHGELRNYFNPETHEITFNKIHSDLFLEEIQRQRHLFTDNAYQRIIDNLNLYDNLWRKRQSEGETKRDILGTLRAGYESGRQFLPKALVKTAKGLISPIRIIVDQNYRNSLTLNGVEEAAKQKIIRF